MSLHNAKEAIYKPGEVHLQDVVTEVNGEKYAAYAGRPVELYTKQGFLILSIDEALDKITKAQEQRYCTGWEEVDQETYDEALEILPPQKWQTVRGVNIFRMCEYTCSNITRHYAALNGRYFRAELPTTTPYSEIAAQVAAYSSKGNE